MWDPPMSFLPYFEGVRHRNHFRSEVWRRTPLHKQPWQLPPGLQRKRSPSKGVICLGPGLLSVT